MANKSKLFVLQWGHVQNDVEINESGESNESNAMLQWGHVQNDVEMP